MEVVDGGTPSPEEEVKPYDPANNPFRDQAPTRHPDHGFPGSFDDIMPEDAPLEDYVTEGEEDDDADGL